MRVAPNAGVAWRDASFRCDGGCFDEHECRAAYRAASQMDQVPITGEAVVGAVLAHRRDNDAVPEADASDIERAEQIDLRNVSVVICVGRTPVGTDCCVTLRMG